MATNTPVNIGNLIFTKPNFRGGRPCLVGTGTTVHTIAAAHLEGLSAEQILEEFPHLDLSRIHAALAYYYANKSTPTSKPAGPSVRILQEWEQGRRALSGAARTLLQIAAKNPDVLIDVA